MMNLFFVLSVMLSSTSVEQNFDQRYYPKLSKPEGYELQVIKRNYYKYGNKLKEIASRRAVEIKMNTLSLDKKVDAYMKMINNNVIGVDDRLILNFNQQHYLKLPLNVQKELVKYYMSDTGISSLSETARKYIETENKTANKDLKNKTKHF